jgi:hypothetical protein
MPTPRDDSGQRYTLPHTDITLTVPVEVSGFDQLELSCGIAFTATLAINGTTVGTIENDGLGGETWLRTTYSHRPAWRAVVDGARDRDGQPMDEEALANELASEAAFAGVVQSVARTRRKYAIRAVEEVRIFDGDEVVEKSEFCIPEVVSFARAVTIAPEQVPSMFGHVKLSEETVRADAWVDDRWVQFYPATTS